MNVLLEYPLFFVFAYLFVCMAGSCWLLRDLRRGAHGWSSPLDDDEGVIELPTPVPPEPIMR